MRSELFPTAVAEQNQVTEYVDRTGNICREYPNLPHEYSFLSGDSQTKILVTPAGKRLYPDTEKFFKRLEQGKFIEGLTPLAAPGAEGVVRTVNDAPFRYATMLSPARLDGVVKTYQGQGDTPLLAHEAIQTFDAIRPAFDEHGLHLLEPYAATNRKLYSPFIRGMNLEKALATFDASAASALRLAIRERAEALHHSIHQRLNGFLQGKGLTREKEGDQLADNTPDIYTNPYRKSEMVKMLVDVCPATNAANGANTARFRNWVLPVEAIKQIQGVGSVKEAIDIVTSKAVVVDPVMLLSSSRR